MRCCNQSAQNSASMHKGRIKGERQGRELI